MQLTHRIQLDPTPAQANYFARASGTARLVWNWALEQWNKQYEAGSRPSAMKLKKEFNAVKYQLYPWMKEVHRDSHAQPFDYLGKAWNRFFDQVKAGARVAPDCVKQRRALKAQGIRLAYKPVFKKKRLARDSFYVANDRFALNGQTIRLPLIGQVKMTEVLRFEGKVLGATVSRTADRWFVAVQVEVPDEVFNKTRSAHGVVGLDLGVKTAATLSTGEGIAGPKPLKAALRRLRIRGRRHSRKLEAAKLAAGIKPDQAVPKGTRLALSNNRRKSTATLARLHARIARVRADFVHKLTTRVCRENQTVVIEDLNVSGMLANEKLARAISDVGFGMFRAQMEYKAKRYGVRLVVADRWYPSSKLCSACGVKNEALALKDRSWVCAACGTSHDRDLNAAINLSRLAVVTALPVAKLSGNGNTGDEMVSTPVGKVTPVSYECRHQDASGQEIDGAHSCALS